MASSPQRTRLVAAQQSTLIDGVGPAERREAAAMMVSAIALQASPEVVALGANAKVLALWADPLERAEALAHVDLLLGVLAPNEARA